MRATPRPGASLRDLLPEDDRRRSLRRRRPRAVGDDGKATPLLVVEKLVKEYPRKGGAGTFGKLFQRKPAPEPEIFRAVDGISFTSIAARASGWSANPAAASRRPPRW